MVYSPPAGYEDFLDDCENSDREQGPYRPLKIEGVGKFNCRKPMPNAAAVLGKAVAAKISHTDRLAYIGLFVQNHMEPDDFDRLLVGMTRGQYPSDSVQEVCRAITTWGTARPTVPSST